MVILRSERLKAWLKVTRKNQLWLAENYRVRPSYISQIMHNRTHISGNFIGFILSVTKMNFDDLFYYDAEPENRQFYGRHIQVDGKVLNGDSYYALIESKYHGNNKVLDIVSG